MERRLGVGEKYWYMADRAAPGNGVALVRLRGPFTHEVLRGALDAAQRRHPLLGVHVERRADGPWFVSEGTRRVPIEVLERRGDQDWQPLAEREVHLSFATELDPLLRVILLRDDERSDVLFTFGHIVGDITSLIAFLLDVLRFATDVAEGREPEVKPLPERPASEELLPPQFDGEEGRQRRREILKAFAQVATRKPQKLKPDAKVPPAARRTKMLERRLSSEVSTGLQERCQAIGISPHGAIVAAALTAIAADIERGRRRRRGGKAPKQMTLGCQQSVNFRRQLRPRVRNSEIGLYGSGVVTWHGVGGGREPWDLAPEITRSFQDAVDRGEHLVLFPLLARVDRLLGRGKDDPQRYLRFMTAFNGAALFATMAGGVPEIDVVGPFEVELITGAAALSWLGSFAVGAPMAGDEVVVGFAHAEPTVSAEHAGRLADATVAILAEMAVSGPVPVSSRPMFNAL